MTALDGAVAQALPAAQVLAEANLGITLADARQPDLPLVYANEAFSELTGYPTEEAIGRNGRFLQGPATDPHARQQLHQAIRARRSCRTTLLNYRKDGTTFWNELVIAPIHGESGALTHWAGVQLDVSHTVSALERLHRERDALADELSQVRALRDVLTPPELPRTPGLDIAKVYRGAEEVAGDFYLVTPGAAGSLVIAVGDAVGHGVRAAQQASFVRSSLATFAAKTDEPDRLLELANTSLIERTGLADRFATCACTSIRPDGTLLTASAGHPPPLALDSGEPLHEQHALPLGVTVNFAVCSERRRLEPGGGYLLYTDGLTEARLTDGSGARVGVERIQERLRDLRGRPSTDVVRELSTLIPVDEFRRPADDVCLLAARTSSRAVKPPDDEVPTGAAY